MLEFNPNKPPKMNVWATYFPDRNPNFKTHSQRNHALSAFQYRSNGILYKWNSQEWEEIYRVEDQGQYVEKGTPCEGCGVPVSNPYSRLRAVLYYKWVPADNKLGKERKLVCRDCYYERVN